MHRVDLALAARMFGLPHPLLGNDVDLERAGRRLEHAHVNISTPNKQPEEDSQRGNSPAGLKSPGLLRDCATIDAAASAIFYDVKEHKAEHQSQNCERKLQRSASSRWSTSGALTDAAGSEKFTSLSGAAEGESKACRLS